MILPILVLNLAPAFQAAVASEALMHEHFSASVSETKGVGIEVFTGQDIALIAAIILSVSRLNALGTRGAATNYVPSSLLGAFHYFSGGAYSLAHSSLHHSVTLNQVLTQLLYRLLARQ